MNNDFYQTPAGCKPNKCSNPGCMYNNYSNYQYCNQQKPHQSLEFDYRPVDDYKPDMDCDYKKPEPEKKPDDCKTTFNLVLPKDITIIIKNCCEKKKCDKKDDDKKDCNKKDKKPDCDKKDDDKKCCEKKECKKNHGKKDDDKDATIITLDSSVTLKDVVKTVNDLITSLTDAGILD